MPSATDKNWVATIRESYETFDELKAFDKENDIASQLGFDDVAHLWDENPLIGGASDPKTWACVKEPPHPMLPEHVDNLKSIALLRKQGFKGSDVSLSTSLFEHGLVWREIPEELRDGNPLADYLFVYKIEPFDLFGRVTMESHAFDSHFDWMGVEDWDFFLNYSGTTLTEFNARPYPEKIYALMGYFGWINVFGNEGGLRFPVTR